MSDSESEESEIELTEQELLEAEQSLLAKKQGKSANGDIVIDLNEAKEQKSKKYFCPGEFGIELLQGNIGESYLDFKNAKKKFVLNEAALESKMDIEGILSKAKVDYNKSQYAKKKEREKAKESTTGRRWFDMAAPELTDEVKNDLKLLKYQQVLSNNTFMKGNDRRGHAKHFQIGTVMDQVGITNLNLVTFYPAWLPLTLFINLF